MAHRPPYRAGNDAGTGSASADTTRLIELVARANEQKYLVVLLPTPDDEEPGEGEPQGFMIIQRRKLADTYIAFELRLKTNPNE